MKHTLHVDSVQKAFDLKQVLTDVYLSCETGEIIGLLGKNGSGKSTLLKIIFGSLAADSRFVKIDNHRVNSIYSNKGKIQYLPQHSFLPTHVKLRKLIEIFCKEEQIDFLCQHSFLKKILKKKAGELSGGEQRLAELMLIIYSKAYFVLIDEPFNGIAPVYKEEIMACISQESKNKGFIITDHDYRNILKVATRLVLLHDGSTKSLKTKDELVHWGYINSLE